MQSRIDSWAKKGGKTDELWESVKDAEKREGVVVCAVENEVNGYVNGEGDHAIENGVKMEVDSSNGVVKPLKQHRIIPPTKTKVERETERLNALLDSVMNLREEIKRGMEVVVWRERLLQLASERADQMGLCGWDQRLCFDDEEWTEIGAGVLESYEGLKEEGGDGEMDVDVGDEQWWCLGQKLCDRHAGYLFSNLFIYFFLLNSGLLFLDGRLFDTRTFVRRGRRRKRH
jgi:COMPASS component SPP1